MVSDTKLPVVVSDIEPPVVMSDTKLPIVVYLLTRRIFSLMFEIKHQMLQQIMRK